MQSSAHKCRLKETSGPDLLWQCHRPGERHWWPGPIRVICGRTEPTLAIISSTPRLSHLEQRRTLPMRHKGQKATMLTGPVSTSLQ